MKNRYTLLLFFLFSIVADSVAQQPEKVTISGTVYDKAIGETETFPGVNIICQDAKTKKELPVQLLIWKELSLLRFQSVPI
ncbi:hypothetical protein NXX38_15940 [Bacteroides sp. BFG-637]|uniref:hypothetical protein n=1 Tax=Bacteroides sp. BFG-637 TaxID=2972764 RepID=UPI002166BC45|nr:hypothetical protein [Bacteroides sp. BFG-637]MCS3313313.1 hypothetical protein [Bacteroides sp. BFG-637]